MVEACCDSKTRKGESVEEKEECPKCKGEGCDHCEGKGYHMAKKEASYGKKKMKESALFSEEELEAIEEKCWHTRSMLMLLPKSSCLPVPPTTSILMAASSEQVPTRSWKTMEDVWVKRMRSNAGRGSEVSVIRTRKW